MSALTIFSDHFVVVSPRGTGQFSIIGDHLSYLMVHIDPGKSVPSDLSQKYRIKPQFYPGLPFLLSG
jgi:hypothetical protein